MSDENEIFDSLTDEENAVLDALFSDLPTEYISILNVPNYKKMIASIVIIKNTIDECVSQYDEKAEYSIRFDDVHSVLLDKNVCLGVRIPKDTGVDLTVRKAKEIISGMSEEDTFSIEPCADGRIDLLFCFKNIKELLSAQ